MSTEETALLPTLPYRDVRSQGRHSKIRFIVGTAIIAICAVIVLRWRKRQVSDVIDHDFGVGFHLTSPHGAVANSYPNGTVLDIAKVDGSPSYNEMMFQLSLPSSQHPHAPYNSLEEYFQDQARQAVRHSRKAAAPSDVDELAALLQSLLSAAGNRLDGRRI
ncbi:hypothetical protein DL98DRAFT_596039 [Cadophora sp. DSE1049]|nr:hypothetical protein DL98DRAFT_596039 [Cadophora sp. DSE1049]